MLLLPLSSTLLVPVIAALLVLVLAVRVARALVHLLVGIVLVLGLLWGYGAYRHSGTLDAAAQQIVAQVHLSVGAPDTLLPRLLTQAHKVLVQAGLDPATLRVTVQCVQGKTSLVLSETHAQGLLGLWGRSTVHMPLSPHVACRGAS